MSAEEWRNSLTVEQQLREDEKDSHRWKDGVAMLPFFQDLVSPVVRS